MPDYMTRATHSFRWLDNVKNRGKILVKYMAALSAITVLSACGGVSSSSSSSYNRNLFSGNSFVAPKSIQTSSLDAGQKTNLITNDQAQDSVESSDFVEPAAIAVAGSEESPVLETTGAAAIEFVEPADLDGELSSLTGVIAEAAGLIDLAACTRGLPGDLATARAGHNLLAVNGLDEEDFGLPVSDLPVLAASALADPAPSAGMVEAPVVQAASSISGSVSTTEALLISAYQQTGRHYKEGGQTPAAGFDSAGFTRWVYGQRGINLPKDIKRQIAGGRQVAKEDLRPGDLLVYRDSGNGDNFHVGIYTGQGNFLHATAKSAVVTETAAFGPQYAPFFVGGRRYYDDPNAAPLSDGQKMAAASSAVKVALAELGPNDKPDRSVKKAPAKSKPKAKKKK